MRKKKQNLLKKHILLENIHKNFKKIVCVIFYLKMYKISDIKCIYLKKYFLLINKHAE